ncbi:hypothetical protein MIDIC_340030 [Alphaproteobacteria bacterium]
MPDKFFEDLNEYLEVNSVKGTRLAFVVRIVAEYIKKNR